MIKTNARKVFLQISVCFLLSNDPQNITTKQLLLTVYGSKVIAVPARGPSVLETPLRNMVYKQFYWAHVT